MLETIFEWLISGLGEVIEAVVNYFMYLLHFDIRYIGAQFPVLGTTYGIFRTIGIGLAVVFATISIAKFTFGTLAESRETPTQVLFRLAISIGLIYFGGYALEAIINIAKLPYDYILGLDAVDNTFHVANAADIVASLNTEADAGTLSSAVSAANAIPVITIGAVAALMITLILLIIIFVNMMKLIVEVAQRLMWLFVILYTAPLAFSTFASKSTSEIMRKWLSMFFSQCLLLVLSVWLMKVALSGFSMPDMSTAEHNYVLQFLLTLAVCKIGANLDREIQRIGLNPTTANGNVFDEIANTARGFAETSASLATGGESGSNGKSPVLGENKTAAVGGGSSSSSTTSAPSSKPQSKVSSVASAASKAAAKGTTAAAGRGAGGFAAAAIYTAGKTFGAMRQHAEKEFEGGHISSVSPPEKGEGGRASAQVAFSGEAVKNGAHIAYSPTAKGAVISANTPQQAADVWNNSVGKSGESAEFSRIMRQTGKAMGTEGATEVFSNSKLKDINAGPVTAQQSGAGSVLKTAVGSAPGMPSFKASDISSLSVSRDAKTGSVVSTATSRSNTSATPLRTPSGAPAAGQGSRITLANEAAYGSMSAQERKGFTPNGNGLYVSSASDFSRQADAIRTLNDGGPSNSEELPHTIMDAYGSALDGKVRAKDISNVEITPRAEGSGAKVSFDVTSTEADGSQTVRHMNMFNGAEGGRSYDFGKDFGDETADAKRYESSQDSFGKYSISFASKPPAIERTSSPPPERPDPAGKGSGERQGSGYRRESKAPHKR